MAIEGVDSQRLTSFLEELTLISRKYRIQIQGCGCCGSPWVAALEDKQENYRYTVMQRGDDLALRSEDDIETQEWWLSDEEK